jgi:hypothetical protein
MDTKDEKEVQLELADGSTQKKVASELEFSPDRKKFLFSELLTIFIYLSVFAACILILHLNIGLSTYLTIFEAFDVSVNVKLLVLYLVGAIVAAVLIYLYASFTVLDRVKYQIGSDKIVLYENTSFFFIKSYAIPFANISRVSYKSTTIQMMLFKYASIYLELNGMDREKVELKYISNYKETVEKIEKKISSAKKSKE